jgi:hypothetical protein
MVHGQDTVSPVAPEIQPAPLLPHRPRGPRPQELRKRFAGRCSYVPLLLHILSELFCFLFLVPKAPSLAPSSRSRLLTLSVTGLCSYAPLLLSRPV